MAVTSPDVAYNQNSPPRSSIYSKQKPPPVSSSTRTLFPLASLLDSLVQYWWAWELSSAAVSTIATCGLVAALVDADERPLQFITLGPAQFTLNSYVAAFSTVIRASLLVTVAGPLNQCGWNWFSPLSWGEVSRQHPGRPLEDLDIFGNAALNSWSSIRLLVRTKFR
jgi:hypothetical protein